MCNDFKLNNTDILIEITYKLVKYVFTSNSMHHMAFQLQSAIFLIHKLATRQVSCEMVVIAVITPPPPTRGPSGSTGDRRRQMVDTLGLMTFFTRTTVNCVAGLLL